ncbi:MAG: hypothetical protein ING73_16990 [Rhodocyclaceae bacterium]|nr:hypothetical protein [Rhodocyclaceae bacterium]MCA3037072.1 hypothetical protein [Rhodocyclaceae bacterium]MCA3039973.1 hypothetical protein [Rhodocyclaceae bacterium]MCA3065201.1 hypothetical protein [Rhodocyclaceae bacterium]MCA3068597.1 hypothetical protein [Rhodocyclaceae bacterium]
MLRCLKQKAMLVVMASVALNVNATPPNTTAANAVPYEVGQGWVTHSFDESTTTRWFSYGESAGRSYCLEAVQGPISPVLLDPSITAYTSTTGTVVLTSLQAVYVASSPVQSDNGAGDPVRIKGARACYIAPTAPGTTAIRAFKVSVPIGAGSGDAGFLRIRVVDTTMYSPSGTTSVVSFNQCNVMMTISNLSTSTMKVVLSMPAASISGNSPGTSTRTANIPANRAANMDLVGQILDSPPTQIVTGPVYVAHDGPPGMLAGTHQRKGFGGICTASYLAGVYAEEIYVVPQAPDTSIPLLPLGRW